MISLICTIFFNDTNELVYKTERMEELENKFMVTKGEGAGRDKLGVWDEETQGTTYKIDEFLLCSTGKYIQYHKQQWRRI